MIKNRLLIYTIILFIVTLCSPALAAPKPQSSTPYDYIQSKIINSNIYSGLVVDMSNGSVLYERNAHKLRHPASLTKLVTLFLVFEDLSKGKIHMNTKIPVSAHANSTAPSNLNVNTGDIITVRDAINALIIKSANNVSVAVAEKLGGSEVAFVKRMNKKCKELGMYNTKFYNPHGLHNALQVTTAHDMSILAMAIKRKYPQYADLFAKKAFVFRGAVINTHNHVVKKYKWANGLKTGYIEASGFNLVTTTSRPTGNLVGVVMGGPTARERDSHMIALLEDCYNKKQKSKPIRQIKPASPKNIVKQAAKQLHRGNPFNKVGDIR